MDTEFIKNHHNTCSKCLLSENYPNIEFNEDNICNYCVESEKKIKREKTFFKNRYKDWMHRIFDQTKKENKGRYDCLLCYSGGKDSTYLLHLLKEEYGLNVFAYTFDNTFESDAAKRNIERTLSKIDVDHFWYKQGEDFWRKIFSAAFKDIFSKPSIPTSIGHICRQCMMVGLFYAEIVAMKKNIPLLCIGLSPHQVRLRAILFPKYHVILSYTAKKLLYSLGVRQRFSCKLNSKEERGLRIPLWDLRNIPTRIFPYYALGYDINKIYETISDLDLIAPGDSHPLNSNCLLNFLMIDLDYRKLGYNTRLTEFAALVREGNLDRQEWLEIFQEVDRGIEEGTWEREKITAVLEKLKLTNDYQEYISRLK